jgi:hypothetical protein
MLIIYSLQPTVYALKAMQKYVKKSVWWVSFEVNEASMIEEEASKIQVMLSVNLCCGFLITPLVNIL